MKKTLLSAAAFAVVAVSAVSIAPTTSEAVPAFARQTGAACLSCHFQSFPSLAAFGRAFKEGAFTDVGEEALVEDDNLSIPSVLNITAMFRPQFHNVKTTTGAITTTTKSIATTADQVLMIAGRIGSNTGAFIEYDGTTGGPFSNQQLLHSVDVGNGKVILSYYNTGFGEDAGLQLMSVWGQHSGLLNGGDVSINGAMATTNAAGPYNTVGVSASYANDMGAITIGGINNNATLGTNWNLAPMVRGQGFFDLGGAELGIGAIVVSGTTSPTIVGKKNVAKRYGLSAQLQGEAGDMSYGIYADVASAKSSSATEINVYNPLSTTNNRTGYSLRATVEPVSNIIAMIGFGSDKIGAVKTTTFVTGLGYSLYQNARINLTYGSAKTSTGVPAADTKVTDLALGFEFLM